MAIRELLEALRLDLQAVLWPTSCVHCGWPDRDCCLPCLVEIARPSELLRPSIGTDCYVRAPYAGAMRSVLVAFKHDGRVRLARELGAQLRVPLRAALEQCSGPRAPVLVTAPSRSRSTRKRGYRHVDLLLRAALRGEHLQVLRIGALRTTRGRRAQVGLRASERAVNAARVAVRSSALGALRGRQVIVVDDIITTGATVGAAREALESAGAEVVAAVALCYANRRDERAETDEAKVVAT